MSALTWIASDSIMDTAVVLCIKETLKHGACVLLGLISMWLVSLVI